MNSDSFLDLTVMRTWESNLNILHNAVINYGLVSQLQLYVNQLEVKSSIHSLTTLVLLLTVQAELHLMPLNFPENG